MSVTFFRSFIKSVKHIAAFGSERAWMHNILEPLLRTLFHPVWTVWQRQIESASLCQMTRTGNSMKERSVTCFRRAWSHWETLRLIAILAQSKPRYISLFAIILIAPPHFVTHSLLGMLTGCQIYNFNAIELKVCEARLVPRFLSAAGFSDPLATADGIWDDGETYCKIMPLLEKAVLCK